jgi:uncharacterized protein YuzE
MRITYDKDANAAYIYIKEISPGEVVQTISLNDNLNIDLDSNGKTLGIEILDANKNLPSVALNSAEVISN